MVERYTFDAHRFWMEHVRRARDENQIRADGDLFYIGPEDPTIRRRERGFNGRLKIVKFNDGRTVRTTNLWKAGHIPKDFRGKLPDNAVFVNEEGKKIGVFDPCERPIRPGPEASVDIGNLND